MCVQQCYRTAKNSLEEKSIRSDHRYLSEEVLHDAPVQPRAVPGRLNDPRHGPRQRHRCCCSSRQGRRGRRGRRRGLREKVEAFSQARQVLLLFPRRLLGLPGGCGAGDGVDASTTNRPQRYGRGRRELASGANEPSKRNAASAPHSVHKKQTAPFWWKQGENTDKRRCNRRVPCVYDSGKHPPPSHTVYDRYKITHPLDRFLKLECSTARRVSFSEKSGVGKIPSRDNCPRRGVVRFRESLSLRSNRALEKGSGKGGRGVVLCHMMHCVYSPSP